jgi:hypothetical protein
MLKDVSNELKKREQIVKAAKEKDFEIQKNIQLLKKRFHAKKSSKT